MNLLTCYLLVETGGCPHPTPMPTLAGRLTLCFAFSMSYCLQQQPVSFSTLRCCSRKYWCGRLVVLGMESKPWWCSLVSRRSLGVVCAVSVLNTLAHRGRGPLHRYASHENLQNWLLPYSYVMGNNSKQTHPTWPVLECRWYSMGNCIRQQKRTFPYRVLPTQQSTKFDEVLRPSAEVVISAEDQTLMESSQMEEMEN